jgi:hypothetical protein
MSDHGPSALAAGVRQFGGDDRRDAAGGWLHGGFDRARSAARCRAVGRWPESIPPVGLYNPIVKLAAAPLRGERSDA